MSQVDVANAKRALSARLHMWAVDEPAKKADGFIEDLVSQGWVMSPKHEARPRPPRVDEQCGRHPGQPATNCGGCRSDDLAWDEPPKPSPKPTCGDAEAGIAAAREGLRKAQR